jgi:hypothetical protein
MSSLLDVLPPMPIGGAISRADFAQAAKACISADLACGAWAAIVARATRPERLRACLALTLDCIEISTTTAKLLTRNLESDPEVLEAQLEACARACATCGAECERQAAESPLARSCAMACHHCEQECDRAAQKLRAEAASRGLTAAAVRQTWQLP